MGLIDFEVCHPCCVYKLMSGYAVKNTTLVCIIRCYILIMKLHVSAGRGHHQVFPQNKLRLYYVIL